LKHSSNDYKTPFERLHRTKPDVAHLRVFRCGAYVFLPEDVQSNNLSPRSELMTFIGIVEGTEGYIFMRSPNNVVFTAIQALFDETLFPKCPTMRSLDYTPVGLPPDDLQGKHNGPPDDESGEYGGGLPPIPVGPAGSQVPWQPMQPQQPPMFPPAYPPLPPSLSSRSSGLPSPVRSGAPSLSPRHSPAQSSDYDHDFFFSKEDQQEYFRKQDIWRQSMEKKKTEEAFQYYSASGNESLDYDVEGNIRPYLWYRLQEQQGMQNIPQVPPQPQKEPLGSQPRCSGRERRPVVCPDNVYGSQNPTQSEQISNREFRENIDDVPAPTGSGNRPDSPPHEGKGKECADYLVNEMVQEGGAGLIKFLLRAAVSSADAKEKIPEVSKVREWHYRDLMHLPKTAQEE
jgi:hypothetical protein